MNRVQIPTVTVDDLPASGGPPGNEGVAAGGNVVLDVREDDEWAAGHIDGAVHVPMYQVPEALAANPGLLSGRSPVVCVCKVGGRSAQVTMWLNQNGYDAYNLAGGMLAWAGAGRPMVTSDGSPAEVL